MSSDDHIFDPARPVSVSNLPPEFRLTGQSAQELLDRYAAAVGISDQGTVAEIQGRGVAGVLQLLTIEGALLNEQNENLVAESEKQTALVAELQAEVARLKASHAILAQLVPALDYRDGCKGAKVPADKQELADSHYADVLSAARQAISNPAGAAPKPKSPQRTGSAVAPASRPPPAATAKAQHPSVSELLASLRPSPTVVKSSYRSVAQNAVVARGTAEFKCEMCPTLFVGKLADRKRGWARFCSKSCKAREQESRTGQHAEFLARNSD